MNTLHSKIIIGASVTAAAALMLAGLVSAQTSATAAASTPAASAITGSSVSAADRAATAAANRQARVAARMTTAEQKGVTAITKRVSDLASLVTRVQAMKNVSDSQKASIAATIQNLSTNLSALQGKIESDTSSSTLRDDLTSITGSYRIYALVMPEVRIIASADRIITIAGMLNTVAAKLNTRLTAAGALSNLSDLTAAMTDLSAKTADAISQAQAAVAEVTPLAPDGGDKTKMAANTAALKDARGKLSAATTDLKAANKDASTVITALKKVKPTATTSMGSTTGQ